MTKTTSHRRSSVKQSTLVRWSDRGFAYADSGLSKTNGIIPFFRHDYRPNLKDIPPGVPIFNLDLYCLQISDPENNQWISICPGALSGSALMLGVPTDGTYEDGAIGLNASGTISDAIDQINEYLKLLCCETFAYASHLGSLDGNTNGNLVSPVFILGRVASPNSVGNPFTTNGWDNNINRDLTDSNHLVWELESGERITDLQAGSISGGFYNELGLFHSEILNPDGSNNSQNSSPSGYISISNLISMGQRKEGFLSIDLHTDSLLDNNSGYIRVEIQQSTTSGTYIQGPLEFFKDSGDSLLISNQGATTSGGSIKYLSGVKFASISGSSYPKLLLSLSGVNVWADTYRADPLLVNASEFGIPPYVVNYNSSKVTKNGDSPPFSPYLYNDNFSFIDSVDITDNTIVNPDVNGNYKKVFYTLRDPFHSISGGIFEPAPRLLINNLPEQSIDNGEYFYDELYRLKPSSSGTGLMVAISGIGRGADAWDSTEILSLNGGLQVINGRLTYPKENYSTTSPAPNPDYSIMASGVGNLTYIRRFRQPTGESRSNGIFRIEGMSELDRSSGAILVDIRVVGDHILDNGIQGAGNEGTSWLSLNSEYNSATFLGNSGDGCFVTANGYSAPDFEFTLGGFSTAYSFNEAIEVRITFKDPQALNKTITSLVITDWS